MAPRHPAPRRPSPALLLGLAALLASAAPALAEAQAALPSPVPGGRAVPAVAILEMANAGLDPRLDYLAGIIQGLLAYDLGGRSDLVLVDRRNLEAVLKEKELALSPLGSGSSGGGEASTEELSRAGRLAGADWLLSGEYAFLGADVLVTLSLTETASARRTVFRDRGPSENLVHALAEKVVERLTGTRPSFVEAGRERSLVSLRDETPGSLALHSPIIDAEIFLDGEFVGFTTGDERKPFLVERLAPGKHRVRTHLDSSFGVLRLPEVAFGDWDVEVVVEPGKRLVLRDPTRHFNDQLYRLIRLWDEEYTAPFGQGAKLAVLKELAFQDRQGSPVSVRLEARPLSDTAASPEAKTGAVAMEFVLTVKAGPGPAESATLRLERDLAAGSESEGEANAGIVRLSVSLERGYREWELELSLERTDIRQNMWRE